MRDSIDSGSGLSLTAKIMEIRWVMVILVVFPVAIGIVMLYSAANGSFEPWAYRQMARFAISFFLMFVVALVNIRFWLRMAYPLYGICIILLLGVEFFGFIGMGAKRWLNLGIFALQPSEVMKVTIILALARYFYSSRLEDIRRPTHLIAPIILVSIPAVLILQQPDLGTALLILITAIAVFYLVGVVWWVFAAGGVILLGSIFPIWHFVLLEYQRARILTFLRPDQDLLGSGYHVMQSKIALGSGGLFGKGFLAGSQSHLSFLPEKHTDFIFTMLAEEFGFVGGVFLLVIYLLIVIYGYAISLRCRNQFGRLLGMGITTVFFLNVFVNIAMVMGLLPVVGMPLPLVSFGGTSMITNFFGIGLILCVFVHRDTTIRPGAADLRY